MLWPSLFCWVFLVCVFVFVLVRVVVSGALVAGALVMRAPLFGVYIMAPHV